ncbi:MAG TPA: M23 family metallopeptidase [Ignavibacteriaceae bacterium]|nr:M23 family metallopeptidase [Ignavibacteriaceae bacterium]
MKKVFYFSNSSLKFVEIKNFQTRLLLFLFISTIILTSLVVGGYYLVDSFVNSTVSVATLKRENKELKKKLMEVAYSYEQLRTGIDSLIKLNDELRITSNLPPISKDERLIGVGGSDKYFASGVFGVISPDLNDALTTVDELTRKLEFEKAQFQEISGQIEYNTELFECIPAIIPVFGDYSYNSYGMRIHPILQQRRFHSGIDIIVDTGTPVYASGKGKVIFVGRRGGYGLEIVIDHGFGYRTVYAHLSKELVKKGQKVSRGEVIAKSGNSGLSSGPHLHYEVQHNGTKLNPVDFFFDDVNFFELSKK